jgi:hypothetical protein
MNLRLRTPSATALAVAALLALASPLPVAAQTTADAAATAQSSVETPALLDTAVDDLYATAGALSRISRIDANRIRLVAIGNMPMSDDARVRILTHVDQLGPIVDNLRASLEALTVTDRRSGTTESMPQFLASQGLGTGQIVAAQLAPSGRLTAFYD